MPGASLRSRRPAPRGRRTTTSPSVSRCAIRLAVARAKTLAAGTASVALALALGDRLPPLAVLLGALAVGAVGYGASIVLHLVATRGIGAARQAALFATAPFVGALVSIPLLGERLSLRDVVAGALMTAGLAAVLKARHAHEHVHAAIAHDHRTFMTSTTGTLTRNR